MLIRQGRHDRARIGDGQPGWGGSILARPPAGGQLSDDALPTLPRGCWTSKRAV